jgi:prevent-host-death family protein
MDESSTHSGRIFMAHIRDVEHMTEVASRELRNNTRGLLDRVASGEEITITVDGIAVATLQPIEQRPTWMNSADFMRKLARYQADPGLTAELRALSPDTTDDLAW